MTCISSKHILEHILKNKKFLRYTVSISNEGNNCYINFSLCKLLIHFKI